MVFFFNIKDAGLEMGIFKKWIPATVFASFLSFLVIEANAAETNQTITSPGYQLEKVSSGFSVPWGMTFISETDLLITEKTGQLKKLNLSTKTIEKISGLPKIAVMGQGGLLDVKAAPNFDKSQLVYFTYSKPVNSDEAATTLARARLKGNQLTEWQDLLVTLSASDNGRHFGSRIAFDDQGHVFFSVGDRGDRNNGQNLKTHAATIIRLNLDGSIPKDNPFVSNKDALDEIWSYGHRNPQGLFYDKPSKTLWAIEHGPRGGDEINLIQKGKNYGWPVISYGKEYWGPVHVGEGTHKDGMEQPAKYFVPSIAPSSLILYRGKVFPQWNGNLFAGALKLTHINRLKINSVEEVIEEERLFNELGERVRNIVVDNAGLIYFSTDRGNIYRVKPSK